MSILSTILEHTILLPLRCYLDVWRELRGINDLITTMLNLRTAILDLQVEISHLRYELKLQSMILARIQAKVDPLYSIHEDDPLRRADSDKIAKAVMAKIAASNPDLPPETIR
jgi:hypothetical protein